MSDFKRYDDWLEVDVTIELTPAIEASIEGIRPHFALHQKRATVTSGYRSPTDQVFGAIYKNAVKGKIEGVYPEFKQGLSGNWLVDRKVRTPEGEIYWWQRTWSLLLNHGFIVNPACDALCLYDSFRDDGSNRKGTLIHTTPHATGLAYDVGGGADRRPNDEYAILLEAQKDPASRIRSMTLETMNNCVHVNVRSL